MPVSAIVVFILRFAVDAVRRVGNLRHAVGIERNVHAEEHDRVRYLCRDGRDQRAVRIQAEHRLRRLTDALDDVIERVRNFTIAVELVAKDVRSHDYFRLEAFQHRLGSRLVALDYGIFALGTAGKRAVHGKLGRNAGDEVRAGFVGKIVPVLIFKRLLDHAGAGRFAVGAGDENGADAFGKDAEHLRTDLKRHPAGKRRAAAPKQADDRARELTQQHSEKCLDLHWYTPKSFVLRGFDNGVRYVGNDHVAVERVDPCPD